MSADLVAGYVGIKGAAGGWHGALRPGPRARPTWTCAHVHASPVTARPCAEAELERRVQGRKEVFRLLRCKPCSEAGASCWWDDVDGDEVPPCPRCGVPLRRLKLMVVGSPGAVDEGNGKH